MSLTTLGPGDGHLFLPLLLSFSPFKRERIFSGSQLKGAVHYGGEVGAAGP